MIEKLGLPCCEPCPVADDAVSMYFAIEVDRALCQPCIVHNTVKGDREVHKGAKQYVDWALREQGTIMIMKEVADSSFDGAKPFHHKALENAIEKIADDTKKKANLTSDEHQDLKKSLRKLVGIFFHKEASQVKTWWFGQGNARKTTHVKNFEVAATGFVFDDAAFRSCGRQKDIHTLDQTQSFEKEEAEAQKDGIVYIR